MEDNTPFIINVNKTEVEASVFYKVSKEASLRWKTALKYMKNRVFQDGDGLDDDSSCLEKPEVSK